MTRYPEFEGGANPALAWLLPVLLWTLLPAAAGDLRGELDLPGIPEDRGFVQDYAGVLSSGIEERLGDVQREAFREHDTAIVVVTIRRMTDYGGGGHSIETFARAWFDHWGIGRRDDDGELINRGMLVLLSTGDREARIELGADWGRRWDRHCARIMDTQMVPEFQRGNYGSGLLQGLRSLSEMALLGPEADPPGGIGNLIERFDESPFETTPLPLWASGLMVLGGVLLIGTVFVGRAFHVLWPVSDSSLLIAGIGLIVGAFLFWVLLAVLAFTLRGTQYGRRYGHAGGGGGAFSSGGGFGGGFSGGGGASGSW